MTGNTNGISRRNVLKLTGGAVAGTAMSGLASASGTVEVNVGYDGASGKAAALDAASDVVREFNSLDIVTVEVPEQAVDGLSARPDVRWVEENGQMHALAQTLPWGVDRVDAEVAHANGDTGSGIDLAIIDTGIDSDHPDLVDNLGSGHAVIGCEDGCNCFPPIGCGNDNDCHYDWDDNQDHGTHCAGIADAVDNTEGVVGVSTEATLHAVKVLDSGGCGSYSDIAAGIEYVADQGWDVGSMSLGGDHSDAVQEACQYADSKGVLLIAAAGNDGQCTDCVSYPAKYPECMAIASSNDSDEQSSFSSQGPEIEMIAPGSDVYSTIPGGYDTFSGTSMATPHVAGAAAQVMAAGYSDARKRLKDTAEDLGLDSNVQGAGLLDVAAALGHDSGDDL